MADRTVADAATEQWPGEPVGEVERWEPPAASRVLAPVAETRPVREPSRTVGENIDFAEQVADELPPGVWRSANLLYVRTFGAGIKLVLRALDWGFESLGRALGTVLVLAALAFVLNLIPLTAWLVPDQFDVSTYLVDEPGTVTVPIDVPVGG